MAQDEGGNASRYDLKNATQGDAKNATQGELKNATVSETKKPHGEEHRDSDASRTMPHTILYRNKIQMPESYVAILFFPPL